MKEYYGVIEERTSPRDWLGSDIILPRTPQGTDSFKKNGSIQYNQTEVSPVSCTVHGAMGAYSALTGYEFTLEQRKEIWQEALNRGANPDKGWYINSAVDLVRQWVNDNLPIKVSSYRVDIGSFEHLMAYRLGYNVIMGYRGNKTYTEDREDNGIIDSTALIGTTYGHCLHSNYSIGDEYDQIVDSYYPRETNLYKIPSANFKTLVFNRVFFRSGYIFIIKHEA